MTDRGLPIADGSPACPFVAFEDERDARADRPDHRHRCFAEAQPAPRALAHQEAYCLSSAFPVCPTFQDWARREAAAAVPGAAHSEQSGTGAGAATVGAAAAGDVADDDDEDPWAQPRPEPPIEERPRRNPPRDWAAPPPWASGGAAAAAAGAAAVGRESVSYPPPAEEGQGLAGSAADRLARGEDIEADWVARPPERPRPTPADIAASPADPDLAGLVGRASREAEIAESHVDVRPPAKAGRRPTVSSTRDKSRERELAAAAAQAERHEGPSWEKARRYEAYPSIKTRANLSAISGVPTIAILFGGVVLAAVVLFFLPGIFGIGGRDGGGAGAGASASPSSAVEETASPSPTAIPEPTPQLYTIKSGDTLSKIARRFNVTLDALLAANKDTIKNPNRIQVGDEIIIPLPETEEVPAEASPSG
ncbi:MAG TPA: LysM domain-containing protein [Candidatus Limnocylindrales bacterium]|nr:LysM domain-containing protein [Candidatus Limnocylindrales bacterium]